MSAHYICDKCGEYTFEQIIVCPRCASKIKESAPSASDNNESDAIAAFNKENEHRISIDGVSADLSLVQGYDSKRAVQQLWQRKETKCY